MFGEFIYSFFFSFGVTLAEGWSQFQISQLVFSSSLPWTFFSEWMKRSKIKKKNHFWWCSFFLSRFHALAYEMQQMRDTLQKENEKNKNQNRLSRSIYRAFWIDAFSLFCAWMNVYTLELNLRIAWNRQKMNPNRNKENHSEAYTPKMCVIWGV